METFLVDDVKAECDFDGPDVTSLEPHDESAAAGSGTSKDGKRERKRSKSKNTTIWTCIMCNTPQKNISNHLLQTHKITGEERTNLSRRCARKTIDELGNTLREIGPRTEEEVQHLAHHGVRKSASAPQEVKTEDSKSDTKRDDTEMKVKLEEKSVLLPGPKSKARVIVVQPSIGQNVGRLFVRPRLVSALQAGNSNVSAVTTQLSAPAIYASERQHQISVVRSNSVEVGGTVEAKISKNIETEVRNTDETEVSNASVTDVDNANSAEVNVSEMKETDVHHELDKDMQHTEMDVIEETVETESPVPEVESPALEVESPAPKVESQNNAVEQRTSVNNQDANVSVDDSGQNACSISGMISDNSINMPASDNSRSMPVSDNGSPDSQDESDEWLTPSNGSEVGTSQAETALESQDVSHTVEIDMDSDDSHDDGSSNSQYFEL